MDQGWIYVLVNASIPGLAKVGRTTRPPNTRVAELSAATGVATPFVLVFDQEVADCCAAEHAVHDELDRRGLRVASNREFFKGSASEIIRIVLETVDGGWTSKLATMDESAAALLSHGDCCLFGQGDTMQDTGEAIRFYKLAATRGSLAAFERLGRIYTGLYAVQRDATARRRALRPLKEGARRGNYYCYAEMGALFAIERHYANFQKAWSLFFSRSSSDESSAADGSPGRMAELCCRYIAMCLELGVDPEHRRELAERAADIISVLRAELGAGRDRSADRHRTSHVLRWASKTLLPGPAPAPDRRKLGFGQLAWLRHPKLRHPEASLAS